MKKKYILMMVCGVWSCALATAEFSIGARGTLFVGAGTTLTAEANDAMKNVRDALSQQFGTTAAYHEKVTVGGGFGIYGKYNLAKSPNLGFQAEINFLFNNGREIDFSVGGITVKEKFYYSSMDIPLMIMYDFPIRKIAVSPMLGINFSIPLGKMTEKASSDYTNDVKQDFKINSRFIPGMIFGLGLSFKAGPGAIAFNVRYVLDFIPIKVEDAELFTRRGLQISAGYEYRFQKH